MATLEEFLKEIGKGATTGIGLTSGVRGILDTLGIGARGLDTPAERDYLQGVMDTANIGYERTGGVMNTGGVASGVMDYAPADQSAFMEKMNWLQNNPNATEQELQLLGIGGGEQQSAFQEKMRWLQNNPDATQQELQMLGIGARGMDTPTERDFMQSVMKGEIALTPEVEANFKELMMKSGHSEASLAPESEFMQKLKYLSSANMEDMSTAGDYTFGVDGQTVSYGFDSRPTANAIKQMRIDQGITADVGARGMNTATEQAFLQKVMQLDPPQQNTVMQVLSGMTDAQKQNFKMQVITGNVPLGGYEVQNTFGGYGELTPNYGGSANRQQMLQYNREGDIQNLGFAGY